MRWSKRSALNTNEVAPSSSGNSQRPRGGGWCRYVCKQLPSLFAVHVVCEREEKCPFHRPSILGYLHISQGETGLDGTARTICPLSFWSGWQSNDINFHWGCHALLGCIWGHLRLPKVLVTNHSEDLMKKEKGRKTGTMKERPINHPKNPLTFDLLRPLPLSCHYWGT